MVGLVPRPQLPTLQKKGPVTMEHIAMTMYSVNCEKFIVGINGSEKSSDKGVICLDYGRYPPPPNTPILSLQKN